MLAVYFAGQSSALAPNLQVFVATEQPKKIWETTVFLGKPQEDSRKRSISIHISVHVL